MKVVRFRLVTAAVVHCVRVRWEVRRVRCRRRLRRGVYAVRTGGCLARTRRCFRRVHGNRSGARRCRAGGQRIGGARRWRRRRPRGRRGCGRRSPRRSRAWSRGSGPRRGRVRRGGRACRWNSSGPGRRAWSRRRGFVQRRELRYGISPRRSRRETQGEREQRFSRAFHSARPKCSAD